MSTPNYGFLKQANKLGPELHSILDQIKDIDREAHSLNGKAEESCRQALSQPDVMGKGVQARLGLKSAIDMQKQVIALSSEKVNLAYNLYQAIDKQVRNLDRQRQTLLEDISRRELALGIVPTVLDKDSNMINNMIPTPPVASAAAAPPPKKKGKRGAKAAEEALAAPAPAVQAPPGFVPHMFTLPNIEPFTALIDPSEPNYCVCQQPSWGAMVACESDTCPYEWFHYACVGLVDPPQTKKWYCPTCRASQDKKQNKRGKK